jgi:hypothetical protein
MAGAEEWYKYQSRLLWHPFKLMKLFDSLACLINCLDNWIPFSLLVKSYDCAMPLLRYEKIMSTVSTDL